MNYEELQIDELIKKMEELKKNVISTLEKIRTDVNPTWGIVIHDLRDFRDILQGTIEDLKYHPDDMKTFLMAKKFFHHYHRFMTSLPTDSYDRQLRPLVGKAHAEFMKADPSTPFYRTIQNLLSLAFPCPTCDGFGMLFYADKDDEFCKDCNGTGVKPDIESYWKYEEEEEE